MKNLVIDDVNKKVVVVQDDGARIDVLDFFDVNDDDRIEEMLTRFVALALQERRTVESLLERSVEQDQRVSEFLSDMGHLARTSGDKVVLDMLELFEETMPEQLHRCRTCGQFWPGDEVVWPIPKLSERVSPGDTVPSGECRLCGNFCYPLRTKEGSTATF